MNDKQLDRIIKTNYQIQKSSFTKSFPLEVPGKSPKGFSFLFRAAYIALIILLLAIIPFSKFGKNDLDRNIETFAAQHEVAANLHRGLLKAGYYYNEQDL